MKKIASNKNTHLFFDDSNIVISPDISPIFHFLIEIDKEVGSLLGFQNQLKNIQEQVLEFSNFITFLAEKLKKEKIDYNYQLSEHPQTIADKLKFHLPVRSQMIVLFAFLETLRHLWIIYEQEISEEVELKKKSSNADIESFFKKFCVCNKNEWVKNNSKKSGKIGFKNLRKLRNSLTHFFSPSALGITPLFEKETKEIDNKTNHKVQFISPSDLYGIIRGANRLILEKWNEDSLNDPQGFKRKIMLVQSVIKKNGAVILSKNNKS